MPFTIVTDSSANLPDEIIKKHDIRVLPLTVRAGEKEYKSVDGDECKMFYDMLRRGEELKTSQINPDECHSVFKEILDGGNDLLYIGFSSTLSGTYQLAFLTAEELRETYPERKILTFDTLAAAPGEGQLVFYAAEMRKSGKNIDEVYDWLKENFLRSCHWFTVDDLNYLKRGGRISPTAAAFGTVLNIKPLMHMDSEGRLTPVGKVRGRITALNALIGKVTETIEEPEKQSIFIAHADCPDDAAYLERKLRELYSFKNIYTVCLDAVIGCHTGPGTISVYFMGKRR
ncbi:MAG: DegV family protein [Clostridiales bacterium]|nr:DegV family protein [Clostridiales bacterium]